MTTIKPIIWIVTYLWMAESNISIFESLNCNVLEIKDIEEIEKVDAVIFPSSIYNALKHYVWDVFINEIFERIMFHSLPIWIMWQTINIFDKRFDLEKKELITELEESAIFDFLDIKPYNIKMIHTNTYKQKVLWNKFYRKFFKELWYLSTWDSCIFRRKNIFVTLFSPEFTRDIRIYEYFLNDVIAS